MKKQKEEDKDTYFYWKKESGKRGYHFSTELFQFDENQIKLEKDVNLEIRDSIRNLQIQNICVELYTHDFWQMNKRLCYSKKKIKEIIEGDTNVSLDLFVNQNPFEFGSNGNNNENSHRINIKFKCYFQEICDFSIFFDDWGGANLNSFLFPNLNEVKKKLKLQIGLMNHNGAIAETKYSVMNEIKELHFKKNIFYRGCLQDLERESLQIRVLSYNSSFFKYCFQARKKIIYPLRGISKNSYFQNKLANKTKDENNQEVKSSLWGKITLDGFPRFSQKTDASELRDTDIQLCFRLLSINLSNLPTIYKNINNIFICIEMNGKVFQSKDYRILPTNSYIFDNELFYFFIDQKKNLDRLKTSQEKKEYIESILKQNNQADISIWIEDNFGCRDFLGRIEINLLDIFTKGEKTKISYMNKNMNTETVYQPKFYHNPKKQGFLAIDEKLDFSLSYDTWFFPEEFSHVEKIDLGFAKEKQIHSRRNNCYETLENLHSQVFFVENYKKKLNAIKSEFPMSYKERFFGFKKNAASQYKRGSFAYNNKVYNSKSNSEHLDDIIRSFYVKDQFGNTRILNSYLSKLTIETDFNDYASKLFEFLIESENNKGNSSSNNDNKDKGYNNDYNKYDNDAADNRDNFSNNDNRKSKYDSSIEADFAKKLKNIFKNDSSLIDKFKPGIGKTIRSYLHFVGCIRYSELDFNKERILINSPDFVLKNRKGSVYEHAILLACLLIYIYNKKNIELINFNQEKEAMNKLASMTNNPNTEKENGVNKNNSNTENDFNNLNETQSNSAYNNYENNNRKDSNESSNLSSPPQFARSPQRRGKGYALLNETESFTEHNRNLSTNAVADSDKIKSAADEKQEKEKVDKNKEKVKNSNFSQEKSYNFSRKELKIFKAFGLEPPKIEEIEKKENIDGSQLVFICMGTLAVLPDEHPRKNHMWVMTISEDLKDINFYDPFLMKEFCLKNLIKDRQMMQWYLTTKKVNFESIRNKKLKFSSHIDRNQMHLQKLREKARNNNLVKITGEDDMMLISEAPGESEALFTIEEEIQSTRKRVKTGNSKEQRNANLQNDNYKFNFNQPHSAAEIELNSLNSENNPKNRTSTNAATEPLFNKNPRNNSSLKNFFREPPTNFSNNKHNEKNRINTYNNNNNNNSNNNFFKSSILESTSAENYQKDYSNTAYDNNNNYNNQNYKQSYKASFGNNKASFTEQSKKDSNFKDFSEVNAGNKMNNFKESSKTSKANKQENVIPYRSIDCIFNKKNIWINMQTPEPDKISYDIWDESKWYPLNFTKNDVANPQQFENNLNKYNSRISSLASLNRVHVNREEIDSQFKNYLINIEDIPAFYTFKDLINPLSEEKIAKMHSIIMESLEQNISSFRSSMNLKTYFKKDNKITNILEMFLILQELESLGYLEKGIYIEKIKEWREAFENLISGKTKYKILPLHINYFDENKIRDIINKNMIFYDFILDMNLRRRGSFIAAVKIFQYPNRVLSIRIMIVGYFSDQTTDAVESKDIYQISVSDEDV